MHFWRNFISFLPSLKLDRGRLKHVSTVNIALKVDFLLADALTDILLLMKRIRHAERGRSLSFRTEEPTIYIAVAENNFFIEPCV